MSRQLIWGGQGIMNTIKFNNIVIYSWLIILRFYLAFRYSNFKIIIVVGRKHKRLNFNKKNRFIEIAVTKYFLNFIFKFQQKKNPNIWR